MKVEFIGAARTVTGSSYILKNENFTIMIDCGMFQGTRELKERNYLSLIYAPDKIDALILTHAHIDHSGLIPKLVKDGFKGKIFATKASCDLLQVMLPDSAHIQEMDAEWKTKRNKKLGREAVLPLYVGEDAAESLKYLNPQKYGDMFNVVPGVKCRFRDAGHILGSSFLEIFVTENGVDKKLVFSGDLGPKGQAIIKEAETVEDADYLFIESTYGDRLHKSKSDTYEEFKTIIHDAFNKKGNMVIPSFAVERTQEIVFTLSKLFREDNIPQIPVFIDSPLAIAATEIFRNNTDCFNDEMNDLYKSGINPLDFPNLHMVQSTAESKELNKKAKGSIIISASGMCTAGRIKFHLQNNLYKPQSSVIFVGYQAEGTLGRLLVDGAKRVRVYGEDVAVNAKIHTLGGFSGHADRDGLLQWMSAIKNKNLTVFVVHGEENAALNFSETIREKFGYKTLVPVWGQIVNLETMEFEYADYDSGKHPDLGTAKVDTDDIENSVTELQEMLHELINKYHTAKVKGSTSGMKSIKHDIEDLKELINMVTIKL